MTPEKMLAIDIGSFFGKMILERSYRMNDFSVAQWSIMRDTMENL